MKTIEFFEGNKYVSPQIEVTDVMVEKGFAVTGVDGPTGDEID